MPLPQARTASKITKTSKSVGSPAAQGAAAPAAQLAAPMPVAKAAKASSEDDWETF